MAAPDFSNILASLGNVDAAAAQDNPYAPIKSAGDSFAPILMRDVLNPATESNISPGGSILAGLLTGLVSGTGDELGRNYVSHQHDLAQNALHDVFNGNAGSVFSRPDGMGDSVFSSLQNLQAAKQVSDAEEKKAMLDRLNAALAEKQASPEYMPVGAAGNNTAQATMNPDGTFSVSTGDSQAGADNRNLAQSAMLKTMKGVPTTDEEKLALMGTHKDLAQALEAGGQVAIGSRFGIDKGLHVAEEVAKSDPAKNYQESAGYFETIQALQGQNTQSAAVSMVRAAAKIMDPKAVVRQGTFEVDAAPGSPALALQDLLSEAKGGGQLSPEHQQQLIDAVAPFVKSSADQYQKYVDTQLGTFGAVGGDSSKVKTLPVQMPTDNNIKGASAPPPAPPGFKVQQNTRTGEYRVVPE